jgi:hypothetical protein
MPTPTEKRHAQTMQIRANQLSEKARTKRAVGNTAAAIRLTERATQLNRKALELLNRP